MESQGQAEEGRHHGHGGLHRQAGQAQAPAGGGGERGGEEEAAQEGEDQQEEVKRKRKSQSQNKQKKFRDQNILKKKVCLFVLQSDCCLLRSIHFFVTFLSCPGAGESY